MAPKLKNVYLEKLTSFENATRQLRWASILVVVAVFPWNLPQTPYIYLLAAAAALYNALRYSPRIFSARLLGTPVFMLFFDTMFVGCLTYLAGNISTPFSGLFIFMIVTASYLYQLPGTLAVALLEGLMILATVAAPTFSPVHLNETRTVILTLFVLTALGYLVSRLTNTDRVERATLNKLRIRSERERLRLMALVDSLNSGIFVVDHKGRVVQHNEAARMLVRSEVGIVGHDFQHVLQLYKRDDPRAKRVDLLKQAASTQRRRDLSLTTDDGSRIDLDINVTQVISDGRSAEIEYIVVCEDISQERTLEEQRQGFIAVASHELRTPIAIIEASLSTTLSTAHELTDQSRQIVEQAHRNTVQLAEIVKDLTILAEAQNDNLPVQVARIDPDRILDECVKDFMPQVEQQGMKLRQHLSPRTPNIFSTEHHIREILQNFLTNALKYSKQGTITIKAEPSRHGGVLFSVHDEGIGISPANQKLLFTKFFRVEDYRTRSTGGSGLGLYLCMELAQRLGAKVWCKSELNKGSTFFLEVPPQSPIRKDQGEVVSAEVATLMDDI